MVNHHSCWLTRYEVKWYKFWDWMEACSMSYEPHFFVTLLSMYHGIPVQPLDNVWKFKVISKQVPNFIEVHSFWKYNFPQEVLESVIQYWPTTIMTYWHLLFWYTKHGQALFIFFYFNLFVMNCFMAIG